MDSVVMKPVSNGLDKGLNGLYGQTQNLYKFNHTLGRLGAVAVVSLKAAKNISINLVNIVEKAALTALNLIGSVFSKQCKKDCSETGRKLLSTTTYLPTNVIMSSKGILKSVYNLFTAQDLPKSFGEYYK